MKRLALLISLFFLVTCIHAEDKELGKELTLTQKTPIETILASPEQYVGQKVQIEGTVVGVCEKRGCWMQIAAKDGYDKIRVKVDDGVIVFPMDAKGKTAVVEGEVYQVTPKQECDEEKEKEGDQECTQEKSTAVYQIKVSGAVIKM